MELKSLLKVFLGTTFVFVFCSAAFSQTDPSIRPQNLKIASPNAAALGKVADIPIGYHTGTPNIDIPIYTVQEGPLQMPISLSYHASGLRVMEQSSWVGAGFSLNAGGMITRSIHGMPDEILSSSGSSTAISYFNNKGYYDYLFMDPGSPDYSPPILGNNVIATYEFAHGRRDGEADMFNFNFNGYSGKFYFRPDLTVALAPQQDIKVKPLICQSGSGCNPSYEALYGFMLTTPDGVKYYFGKDSDMAASYNSTDNAAPLEHTTSYSATSGLSYNKTASSWFLRKIESPDKKFSISLVYSAEDYAYYTTSLFPQASFGSALEGIDLVKNIMQGVRLSSIKFSNNGQVSFIPSYVRKDLSGPNTNLYDIDVDSTNATAPRALGKIRISTVNNADTTFCQSFVFAYGYFNDTSHPLTGYMANQGNQFNIHSDKKRLKLNTITEKSCDGSVIKPPHKFTYFDETSVPRTLSFGQDHWGYYNGYTSNASMLPPISIDNGLTNLSPPYGNRDSKWPEMRAGALQKIQYPTGGYSRFAFESHRVFIPVSFYDSTYIGELSAINWNTVGPIPFHVVSTSTMKLRTTFPYYPNGAGTIRLINTSTSVDYGFAVSQGLKIFKIPPGDYEFSVQSNTSGTYPVMCRLYTIDNPGYQQQQAVTVGGLRIDSLFYNNGMDNTQKIQTFDYVDENGTDQGVLFSRPAYISLMKNYTIKEHGGIPSGLDYQDGYFDTVNGCIAGIGEPFTPTNFMFYTSANAILPLATSQGNHFGYNYVKVTESDGGYTVYKFMPSGNPSSDVCVRVIDHNDCNDFLPNYPPAPEPFRPDRGEMISKSVYNSLNALLYKEVYTNDYQYEQVGVRGLITIQIPFSSSQDGQAGDVLMTEYEWKSKKKIKSTVETYTYDASNPGATALYKKSETFFESIRHTQPTRTVVSDGAGKVLSEVRNTFTADLVLPSCPDLEPNLNTLDATLISNLATRHTTYNTGDCGPNDSPCKLEKWLRYTYYSNIDRQQNVNTRIAQINQYKECIDGTAADWRQWASPELKAIVKLKTRNQVNAIVERSQWRDGKFLSAESVTYQDFGNDTISYFPGKLDVIKVAAPLSAGSFTPIALTNTIVTRDNKYTSEETYAYSDGNPVEVTAKNGTITSYIWGYSNSQPIAQVINAKKDQIYHNSFETSGGITGISKTGSKYLNSGTYTIPFTPADGATYKMSYWYWNTGTSKWEFSGELPFTATITNGTKLDEIRVYPAGSTMSTYTYDIGKGITSTTDPNGVTSYFQYDELGRLLSVKDNDNNIVKNYFYHYKQ